MDIKSLFGLPAHPLLVHIPIVLLPLVAIGAIAIAVSARAREKYGTLVLVLAFVAFIGTLLAAGSGEALVPHVATSAALREHIAIAGKLRLFALVLLGAVFGILLLDRLAKRGWKFPPALNMVVAVMTVVIAIATTGWLIQVGHDGATATWQHVNLTSGARQDPPTVAPGQ